MKIAYITSSSPYNKLGWSGTYYYTLKALQNQGHDVYCIYDAPKISLFKKIKTKIFKIFNRNLLLERTDSYSKSWANKIIRNLQPETEVILSLSTIPVAYLKTDIPIYIYIDDIFEHFRTYYNIKNLHSKDIIKANRIEQRAINNCRKIISSSNTTAEAIVRHYKLNEEKLQIVPFGANIDYTPNGKDIEKYIASRKQDELNILFVGVEFKRKGCDIVLETIKLLHNKGINVKLHIRGLKDINIKLPNYVINHGFLNKRIDSDKIKLEELYAKSHFLFVPSLAEAYGLVFAEAGAYALPSISHNTGGISTIIKNGVNGKLFEIGTTPQIFADYIIEQFNNYDSYIQLARMSYKRFIEELNWDIAGKRISQIINSSFYNNQIQ